MKLTPMVAAMTPMIMSIMQLEEHETLKMAQTCQTFLFVCQDYVGAEKEKIKVSLRK